MPSVSRRNAPPQSAAVVYARAEGLQGEIRAYRPDVTEPAAVAGAVATIEEGLGPIGQVVLNAGTQRPVRAAVQAADLADTLNSDGAFTVFAPTDAAFAKLPDGAIESLLKPENKDQLVAVLSYHVVPGKIMSSDIAGKKAQVPTVQGGELSVDATSGVMVDNAMVAAADIEASNGVIHVIDTVVLPN